MKFYCDQCKAQYFIADERIGPKGVKIRCKRCENIIIIRPQDDEQQSESIDQNADEETMMREEQHAQAQQELSASSSEETAMVNSPYDGDEDEAPAEDEADDDPMAAASDFGDDETLAVQDHDDDGHDGHDGHDDDDDGEDPFADLDSEEELDDRTMADFRSPGRIKDAFAAAADEDDDEDDISSAAADENLLADASADDDDVDNQDDEDDQFAAVSSEPAPVSQDGDLLDNELSGAFDNVFGDLEADGDDPFSQPAGPVEEDQSRMSTRFYSQGEIAKVEDERQFADDDDASEDDASNQMDQAENAAPQFEGFGGLDADEEDSFQAEDPAPTLSTEQVWYVAIDDEQVGPESETDLAQRWQKHQVDGESLVWQSGMADWLPLREVDELKLLLAQQDVPAPKPLQTEVERPSGLADFAPLADPFSDPVEGSDPFASVGDADALAAPAGSGPGWRPHGMTEIYQAASLAESSAMQAAPSISAEEAQDDDEIVDWQPGAAAALASLVEDEISMAARSSVLDDDQISSADDADLIAPKLKAPDDALVSGPGLGLPAGLATPLSSDPFSQQLDADTSDDINLAQLAGQSSMVMQRPSYVAKPKRELPWPLILGIGGGALAFIGMFVVLLILVLRDPQPQVVVQAPAAPAVAAKTAAKAQPAAAAVAAPVKTEQAAAPVAAAKTPVKVAQAEPKQKTSAKARRSSRSKPRSSRQKAKTVAKPEPAAKPAPKAEPKKRHSGNCDPILYPDGNCPTGSAALAPSATSHKKKKLSKIDVLKVVKRNIKSVKRCVAEQKKRNPRLARGTIKMSWYIRPDGRTKNVGIATPKFKGTYVGSCIKKSVKRWRFSSFDGEDMGPINFPFPLD